MIHINAMIPTEIQRNVFQPSHAISGMVVMRSSGVPVGSMINATINITNIHIAYFFIVHSLSAFESHK